MGRMWKYEPEDYEPKKHLKGKQFKSAVTMGYEFDNDGKAIIPEPTESTSQKIAREKGNAKRSKADL